MTHPHIKTPWTVLALTLAAGTFLATGAFAESRTFDVDSFNAISISAGIQAEISVGGPQSVSVEQRDGKFDELKVSVAGGRLKITRDRDGWRWFGGDHPQFHATITVPELIELDVSAGSEVSATGINAADFSVDVSSGSEATVSGTCGTLRADASSGAEIHGRDLHCQDVTVDVSSGADAEVFAGTSVNADASSGADVTVYGHPAGVKTDTSSGGGINIVSQ